MLYNMIKVTPWLRYVEEYVKFNLIILHLY